LGWTGFDGDGDIGDPGIRPGISGLEHVSAGVSSGLATVEPRV
jgi:hypothetical protein